MDTPGHEPKDTAAECFKYAGSIVSRLVTAFLALIMGVLAFDEYFHNAKRWQYFAILSLTILLTSLIKSGWIIPGLILGTFGGWFLDSARTKMGGLDRQWLETGFYLISGAIRFLASRWILWDADNRVLVGNVKLFYDWQAQTPLVSVQFTDDVRPGDARMCGLQLGTSIQGVD